MGWETKLRSIAKDARHLHRGSGEARSLVVLGCQRSGTNALVGCFEDDPDAKVFAEHSRLNLRSGEQSIHSTVRYTLRLRPLDEVAAELDGLRYPLAVLKPLVESQRVGQLLDRLPRCRVAWIFRRYADVAESNARAFGADVHRRNLEPIAAGDRTNWRSEGAGENVRQIVARHYRADMDPIDGGALFWWARNRLLFDLGFAGDRRVLVLDYDGFVADPSSTLRALYLHAGVAFPGEFLTRTVTGRFVGRGSNHPISTEIRDLCEALWSQLKEAAPEAPVQRADR